MKKYARKTKIIIALSIIVILITVSVVVNKSRNCQDIIGDGYAMGTDEEPIVIGNTCDR